MVGSSVSMMSAKVDFADFCEIDTPMSRENKLKVFSQISGVPDTPGNFSDSFF